MYVQVFLLGIATKLRCHPFRCARSCTVFPYSRASGYACPYSLRPSRVGSQVVQLICRFNSFSKVRRRPTSSPAGVPPRARRPLVLKSFFGSNKQQSSPAASSFSQPPAKVLQLPARPPQPGLPPCGGASALAPLGVVQVCVCASVGCSVLVGWR